MVDFNGLKFIYVPKWRLYRILPAWVRAFKKEYAFLGYNPLDFMPGWRRKAWGSRLFSMVKSRGRTDDVCEFYGLFREGRVIGGIEICFLEDVCYERNLFVVPEEQGKGYGKLLNLFWLGYGMERGYCVFESHTREDNLPMYTLKSKLGFELTPHFRRDYLFRLVPGKLSREVKLCVRRGYSLLTGCVSYAWEGSRWNFCSNSPIVQLVVDQSKVPHLDYWRELVGFLGASGKQFVLVSIDSRNPYCEEWCGFLELREQYLRSIKMVLWRKEITQG